MGARRAERKTVISISGHFTYGASDYILKPVENDKLLITVSKLAELIRKEQLSAQIGKEKLIGDLIRLFKKNRPAKNTGQRQARRAYLDQNLRLT
jgi:YesN/AraC family two-component response regulator